MKVWKTKNPKDTNMMDKQIIGTKKRARVCVVCMVTETFRKRWWVNCIRYVQIRWRCVWLAASLDVLTTLICPQTKIADLSWGMRSQGVRQHLPSVSRWVVLFEWWKKTCLYSDTVTFHADFWVGSYISEINGSETWLRWEVPEKQLKFPVTDEWIRRMWYIHTQRNITQP